MLPNFQQRAIGLIVWVSPQLDAQLAVHDGLIPSAPERAAERTDQGDFDEKVNLPLDTLHCLLQRWRL